MLVKPSDGPWRVELTRVNGLKGHLSLAVVAGTDDVLAIVARRNGGTGTELPTEANARLLSAAPDLLSACRATLENMTSWHEENEIRQVEGPCFCATCEMARAAIAKATGQEATDGD